MSGYTVMYKKGYFTEEYPLHTITVICFATSILCFQAT